MSIADGHEQIISRIVSGASVSVMLPNGPGKPVPRYVLQEAGGRQMTSTLQGDTDAYPEVVVLVQTEAGDYSTLNAQLLRELAAMFVPGTRFGDPEMTVVTSPEVRPPLPVEFGVYTVPVIVRASFTF